MSKELELVSSEDMIDELKARHTGFILGRVIQKVEGEESIAFQFGGPTTIVRGLAAMPEEHIQNKLPVHDHRNE